ncbi:MAG TPA: bifunctional tetrahydrofolate synthase/dihydrofolate synthase [Ideonella sp.]|uniref:bifunctional tetrahydrofolate synthase/dihydrofolate synthase n=1 Tax=Ideonella sp. TaxID=1929293 RepID=UPI002E355F2C|nr:bifunctional tetrahydrofolate synthase/dihydrofolate synthase [Ideonella sp.]HEX5686548.1 bifunctional tetrahydrofolate synthase/dihydrofolate synthase [Ideonella sp.]
MTRTLDQWLAHSESLHPKTMDLSLERVQQVRDAMGLKFSVPVITVAGTNGKGSTCSMIESIARAAGYRVGLYIKPHLVHFEERCRVNGAPVSADSLCEDFETVERARGEVALTTFEFSTLAIMQRLAREPLDLVILEVGLGGRYDAVNAIDADCSVITSIDLDHTEFLGPDRESIGREKAGILRTGRPGIVSDPMPPQSILDTGLEVGADLWLNGRDFNHQGDRQQWAWSGRGRRYHALAYPALRGANQLLNASGAIAALESLRERLPITAQAVRLGLASVDLQGRFQIVPGQPALVLDVAHNPQAVSALALNLDQMGFFPRTLAVFGAMRDKDLAGVMARIAPLVDHWHLTDLPLPRAATADDLAAQLRTLQGDKASCSTHASPTDALAAALVGANPTDRIVVFGSFYTVGGVLKQGLPRLSAPHQA